MPSSERATFLSHPTLPEQSPKPKIHYWFPFGPRKKTELLGLLGTKPFWGLVLQLNGWSPLSSLQDKHQSKGSGYSKQRKFKGCRPVPPTPPLGGQPRFFLFCQRLLAGSGLLACLLARLLACLLVFSAFPGWLAIGPQGATSKNSFASSLEAALASLQRARTKGVRRQPAPPRPSA